MFAKRTREDTVIDACNGVLLAAIAFATLYPFYFILIMSLNEGMDAMRGGMYWWPRKFTLDNYAAIFADNSWVAAVAITVFRTAVGTGLALVASGLMAYGLSCRGLMFHKVYFLLLIVSMYFSGGLIPQYILLRELHLLNTLWVYVIPYMLNPFFILIMVAFFREIPDVLKDSAKIDGASDARVFASIIVPVSGPLFATMALFIGVFHWNAWLDAAYFVQNPALRTMSYKMMEVINKSVTMSMQHSLEAQAAMGQTTVTTMSLQMATIMVAVAPILFVYPFLQKYFVHGMMLGSVKG